MKQGSRATAKKRQILHRPLHCESDSSSSLAESNDSLSGQDSNRHKEKEHYNKLKVNIDSISRNKVLSGKIFLHSTACMDRVMTDCNLNVSIVYIICLSYT